jgi:6-phosphogluconolactonase
MNGTATGITRLRVREDGTLADHGVAAAIDSPSSLLRFGTTLYAVGEGVPSISAFRVHGDELTFLGSQEAAGGFPCRLAVLGEGTLLAAACYANGVIDVHPIARDGSIERTSQSVRDEGSGPRPEQDGPHAHDVLRVDATTVLTADLGTDRVSQYSLDASGLTLTATIPFPAGSGPRDLLRHPSGLVFALAELSGEVFVLGPTDAGFERISSVALPGVEAGDHAAALALSDDGLFLYSGLRGSDRIAVLGVSPDGMLLTPIGFVDSGGGWPRHLVTDGPYLRVANQLANSVVTFEIGADGFPVRHSSLHVGSPTYLLAD